MRAIRDHTQRSNRTVLVLLALGLFAFYLVIQYGVMQSWDGRINAGVAKNLWEHQRLEVFGDSFGVVDPNPSAYSKYGIGISLLLAPMWQFDAGQEAGNALWLTLVNPVLSVIAALAIYEIGLMLGWRQRVCVLTAIAFGTLTMVPIYSTELLNDTGPMMCAALLMLGLLRWQRGRGDAPWLAGSAVAGAILFRVESIFVVAPALLLTPMFVPLSTLRATVRRWAPALLVPLGLVGMWLAYYDNLRYGSPFTLGHDTQYFTGSISTGLWRQMGSTGKGFFWYDPILLAALPGLVLLWRRHRGMAAVGVALFVGRLLLFARFLYPDGDVAWGPRYLLLGCAVLAVPLGETLERIADSEGMRRRIAAGTVALLAAASGVVVFAGLWVPYTYSWEISNNVPGYETMAPGVGEAIVASRVDRQNNDWYWSPIVLNLRVASHSGRFSLRHWMGGPSLFGVAALVTSATALTSAVVLASGRRRHSGDTPSDQWSMYPP